MTRLAAGGFRFLFFLARGGVGFFSPTSYSLSCVLWKPPLVLGCVNIYTNIYVCNVPPLRMNSFVSIIDAYNMASG